MPVIVIGADHPLGAAVVEHLAARVGEVRAFVSDPRVGEVLRARGIKVAVGDVSDTSHVAGAALGAFAAVLVTPAAGDGRETAFAEAAAIPAAWGRAVAEAGVTRVIVLADEPPPLPDAIAEQVVVPVVGRPVGAVAAEVAAWDDLDHI